MLMMLNEKNSWGQPTCKNMDVCMCIINTHKHIICLNMYKYLYTPQFFLVQKIEKRDFPLSVICYLYTSESPGGLLINADSWVPPQTYWISLQSPRICLRTCFSTYVILTSQFQDHWTRSCSSLGGGIISNHLLSWNLLKKILYQAYAAFMIKRILMRHKY